MIKMSATKRRYWRLKNKGICVMCGKAPAVDGIALCEKCREKYNEYRRGTYALYAQSGICPKCRKRKIADGMKICKECAERIVRNREARKRRIGHGGKIEES